MKREGVPRGSTRVGKPLTRVTTLLVHVSTGGPHICHVAVPEWAGHQPGATCHYPTGPHQQLLHQTETHGSLWLGQVSSQVPRGTLPLVHISKWAPPRHKSPVRWAPPQCHVAVNQWSTSCQLLPHGTTTGGHFNMSMPHGTATSSHLNPAVPHGKLWFSHFSTY
jgi:hypothetical protein